MTRIFSIAFAAALATGGASLAQQMSPEEQAHAARRAHMQLYAHNLGPLGAMARGDAEYDPALAALHARNLTNLALMDHASYWVEGTAAGVLENSRALPEIWANREDFDQKQVDLAEAADNLVQAAPEGHAAFVEAFRALGQSCGACHDAYRQPDD